ncbi:glutathione S-transferase [Alteromonas aestuariivivens]|uniref:Glutathione S-transferase n=1 Tax=Alteromonas aestuariivivens TaxID=1938339 RepID=A0A3D8M7I4_9ALTE|nr:glutathione S-transferase [Alteromonas aestuariivivens]RDV25514.1 glutathione S-transferase [Alteromonas aestuariivivens]
MLVLHHLEHSRSQRILWLLEELGVNYAIERYARDPKTGLAPKILSDLHPLGRSPLLECDEGILAESAAIVEYLVGDLQHAPFARPVRPKALQQYHFWLHFAEGSLMPSVVATMILRKARAKAKPFFVTPIVNKVCDGIISAYYGPNLAQSLDFVEEYLTDHQWFADDRPTGADVQMVFPLEAMLSAGLTPGRPAISEYVARIHQRPAYLRALEKGGPYAYASKP